jgi:hypothetical protein
MSEMKVPTERSEDWKYVYRERLGMLCGDDIPTREQVEIARRTADLYMKDHPDVEPRPVKHPPVPGEIIRH